MYIVLYFCYGTAQATGTSQTFYIAMNSIVPLVTNLEAVLYLLSLSLFAHTNSALNLDGVSVRVGFIFVSFPECTCVCAHVCVCARVCRHARVYVCMRVHVYVYVYVHMHVWVCVRARHFHCRI